jgi:hypothetical protein
VIRFSAFLVVVAVGLLVAGVVTSKLLLVYIAIGVSGVALLALGIGAAVNWRELTSKTAQPGTVESSAQGPAPPQAPAPQAAAPQAAVPEPVPAPAAAAAAPAPSGPSREPSAPDVWEWRDDSLQTPAPPTSPHPTQRPEPEPASEPDRDLPSEADLPSEPELTRVPGTTVVSAAATSQAKQPDQAEQPAQAAHPDQDKHAGQAEPAGPDPAMEVTVVPGVPRYHRARCILIRFMGDSDLDKMTLTAAREAGCTPCRACLPDQPGKSPE